MREMKLWRDEILSSILTFPSRWQISYIFPSPFRYETVYIFRLFPLRAALSSTFIPRSYASPLEVDSVSILFKFFWRAWHVRQGNV